MDNYDSYTYNLFQQLTTVNGTEPTVVRNDDGNWASLMSGDAGVFDNIVISPGPGRPENPSDIGLSADAIAWARTARVPLLGVCLGHQAVAVAYGARTAPADRIMHGRLSGVHHRGRLMTGVPQHSQVVRYHSLTVPEPLPDGLIATAWADDGTLMALEATDAPLFGVQFHPESILTRNGLRILENFRDLTPPRRRSRPAPEKPLTSTDDEKTRLRVTVRRIPGPVDAEVAFAALRSGSPAAWLDSATGGRFSYLTCGPGGPLRETLRYAADSRTIRVTDRTGERLVPGNLFDHLHDRLDRFTVTEPPHLPFDFTGGYVGYLGYECDGDPANRSPHRSPHPDAVLLFADRLLVLDHEQNDVYLVALDPENASPEPSLAWITETSGLITSLRHRAPAPPPDPAPAVARPERGRTRYHQDIAAVRRHLEAGESYEVCLTTRFVVPTQLLPLDVHRRLRRLNPAPYGAFLDLGEFSVASSSPERFLRVDRSGRVSAKPIKGTRPRSADPTEDARLAKELESDVKERAENLMIVDLLRNDLGRVCRAGSVVVPRLMHVESFSTVHQLVSTVEGDLAPGRTAVDCVQAAFPGGSMTGAPKIRTMRILTGLEERARGVYSGALGYLGVNGTADLSIVIRTLVHDGDTVSVGAGGAITVLSDPEQEWREVRLKADSVLRAVNAVSSDEATR
ncbi:aminodeoxychorismate synthase component I [Kineosporia sp. J2-2]|uniref:aminodeoxychorismate synthase n=1 Tax=Kineosporia corallincola TaxID=2835133 RepID=A0ABS5T8C4_9ACTN|nr:aminodeoxychorismate synthase component I [Kineosporia corallincola]